MTEPLDIAMSVLSLRLDNLGGLQQRVRGLVAGLARHGHRITLVHTPWAHSGSTAFLKVMGGHGVGCRDVGSTATPNRPDVLGRLFLSSTVVEALSDFGVVDLYDPIVSIPRPRAGVWIYSSIGFWPYHLEHLRCCGMRQSAHGLFRTLFEQPALLRADGLIVENAGMAQVARRFYRRPAERTHVILPGYDAGLVAGIMPGAMTTPRIVFAGRVTRLKGMGELLEAFAEVVASRPEWRLAVLGDGPELQRYRERSRELGLLNSVEFAGRLDPTSCLHRMAEASIVVLPSYIEGVPLSVLEGMALGRAVVATDVGAIRRHLIRDTTDGRLVARGSARGLAQALAELMDDVDLRVRLGAAARRRVAELTDERMVAATERAYRATIRSVSRRRRS